MTVPGVYGPEQIAAHVERVIASDGVDDEAKVEVMARAMAQADQSELWAKGIRCDIKDWKSFVPYARAALNALREMEGE